MADITAVFMLGEGLKKYTYFIYLLYSFSHTPNIIPPGFLMHFPQNPFTCYQYNIMYVCMYTYICIAWHKVS